MMPLKVLFLCLSFAACSNLIAQPIYGNCFMAEPSYNAFQCVTTTYDGGAWIGGSYRTSYLWMRINTQASQRSYQIANPPQINASNFKTAIYTSDFGNLVGGKNYYAKLDSSGAVVWYGGAYAELYLDACELASGDYVLVGSLVDFNTISSSFFHLKKVNTQGVVLWDHTINTGFDSQLNFVHELPNGDLMVTGRTFPMPYLAARSYMQRLDAQGNNIWSKSFDYTIKKAVPIANGDYLLLIANHTLMRVNSNGDSLHSQSFQGGTVRALTSHPDGGCLLLGQDTSGAGLLAYLDSSGTTIQWQQTFPHLSDNIVLNDAAVQANGDIVVVGVCSQSQKGYWAKVNAQGQYISVNQLDDTPFEIQLFPNPTASTLNLQLSQPPLQPLIAQIFNLEGQVLRHQTIQQTHTSIALENLPSGTYILRVVDPNTQAQASYHIVKQ